MLAGIAPWAHPCVEVCKRTSFISSIVPSMSCLSDLDGVYDMCHGTQPSDSNELFHDYKYQENIYLGISKSYLAKHFDSETDIQHSVVLSYLPNPSARAGYDTRSIFKQSLAGLNSEFSFS